MRRMISDLPLAMLLVAFLCWPDERTEQQLRANESGFRWRHFPKEMLTVEHGTLLVCL
jgi:hypothetical protein